MRNQYPKKKNASETIADGFDLILFDTPERISKGLNSMRDGVRAVSRAFSTVNTRLSLFSNLFIRHDTMTEINPVTYQETSTRNNKLIFRFKYEDILGYPINNKEKIRNEIIQTRTREGFHRPIELQIEATDPQKLKAQHGNILKACDLSSFNRTNPVDITPIVLTASETLSL